MSAYGPGRDAPQQLFGGQPREQSFEELRLRHYELASTGNQPQAIQEAQILYNNAEQQIQTALADLDGAIKYITGAANQHPNRLDICSAKGDDPSRPQQPSGVPHAGARGPSSGSAFGQSSFGKPSAPAVGQSSFGQSSAPAFGKTSFAQMAAPASAFGQPTSLGQKQTAFGLPSNPNPTPAFGQASTASPFGQAQQAAKPFGVQQPQQQPGFGQQSTPLGQQTSTGTQGSGIFGQPQTSAPTDPFGQAPTASSAFAKPTAAPTNPFGQPAASQTSNPFGEPSAPQPVSNPFGSKDSAQSLGTFGQPEQTPAPAFGQPAAPIPTGMVGKPANQTSNEQAAAPASTGIFGKPPSQTTNAGSIAQPTQAKQGPPTNAKFGQGPKGNRILLSWQGQKVSYIDGDPCVKHPGDGGWQKIWFPEGAPTLTSKTQEYPDGYVLDDAAREKFKRFLQEGVGSDGLIPDMPPPRDMISWDF